MSPRALTTHAPTTTAPARRGARRAAGLLAAAVLAVPVGLVPAVALPGTLPAAAASQQQPSSLAERVLAEAPKHDGKRYRRGATGPHAFDCSGYVQHVFRAAGRELPRTSRQQYAASTKVAKADRQPGDLIAVQDRRGRVTHVGIYAGDDRWWVASSGRKRVLLQRLYTDRYSVGRFA
jgi:peptidoglycan DL-endopeptidase CwlO